MQGTPHCPPTLSGCARLAIVSSGYDEQLAAAVAQVRPWGAVAVFGAGVSFAGYPMTAGLNPLLWQALDHCPPALEGAAATLGRPVAAAKELIGDRRDALDAGYAQLRTHEQARAAFQEGFASLDRDRQPSPAHDALAVLMHQGLIELAVSYNWDTAVERAWAARFGTTLTAGTPAFVKPHGDAAHADRPWVLPDEPGLVADTLVQQVRAMLQDRPRVLMIVGYSESDADVVRLLIDPTGTRWPVVRIGPGASGPLAVAAPADRALPDLQKLLAPEPHLPGWRWVNYAHQQDLGAALQGYRLGPQDTRACPPVPEAAALVTRLSTTNLGRLQAPSGCGKSVTAFHAARAFNEQGWEILELAQPGIADRDTAAQLARTRHRTLAVVDDAQALPAEIVQDLERLASTDRKILLVQTEDAERSAAPAGRNTDPATVRLVPDRAVKTLADHIAARERELLPLLRRLDDRLGESAFSTPLRTRLDEARRSDRPWQFMFVLTGGERRAAEHVAEMRALDRADLMLALLGAEQFLSLDAGADQDLLIGQAAAFGRTSAWAATAIRALAERKLALAGPPLRTPHLKFAAYALRAVIHAESPTERTALLAHLRNRLCDPAVPLRAVVWMLNELRDLDNFRYGPDLINRAAAQVLIQRCQSASRDERGAAALVMWNLSWFQEASADLAALCPLLVGWIAEATDDAHALRWAASGMRSRETTTDAWSTALQSLDPAALAAQMQEQLGPRSVWDWQELVTEIAQAVPAPWMKQFADAIDRNRMTAFADTLNGQDVAPYTDLAIALIGTDPPLAFTMINDVASTIAAYIQDNPGGSSSDLFEMFLYTFRQDADASEASEYHRAARQTAQRIIAAASWEQVGRSLSHQVQREWHSVDVLAQWLHGHDPAAYARFTSSVDLTVLEPHTEGLWADLGALRPLLTALGLADDREPARTWLDAHASQITSMPGWAATLAPTTAVAAMSRGVQVSLDLQDGLRWEWATDAVEALAAVDPGSARSLLERHTALITQALLLRQPNMLQGLGGFLAAADAIHPQIVARALCALDPAQAREHWSARLGGDAEEQEAAKALVDRARSLPGAVGEMAGTLDTSAAA